MNHTTTRELVDGVSKILDSPQDHARVDMIVCRPGIGERRILQSGYLDEIVGLVGDNWSVRRKTEAQEDLPHPGKQLTIMNTRVIELIAGKKERWPLAGDQFYLDLNLGPDNLPPGTHLSLGSATIVIADMPHLGCEKFARRFGSDALTFVCSELGRSQNFRGVNATVVKRGTVRVNDIVTKLPNPLRPW